MGQLTKSGQWDIPYHCAQQLKWHSGRRKCGFVFQDSCCLEPACGRHQVIAFVSPAFFLFLSFKLCSSWLRSIFAFAFPILSPFLLVGRREWAAMQVLSYWPEWTHHSSQWDHRINWVTAMDLILQIWYAQDTSNSPGFLLIFFHGNYSFFCA